MNRRQFEFLLILVAVLCFTAGIGAALLILLWIVPDRASVSIRLLFSSPRTAGLLLTAFLLFLAAVLVLGRRLQAYLFTTRRLAEEITLTMLANPSYRLTPEGPPELRRLAEAVNAFAEQTEGILDEQESAVETARAELAEERNRLAALLSDLAEGVLVCNLDGQILLYNEQAKSILERRERHRLRGQGGFVGLGRSVFGLIDHHVIANALEHLQFRIADEASNLTFTSIAGATNGRFVRIRMAPVFDQDRALHGFVLTLEDVTRQLESSSRRDRLLRSLTADIRAPLANIRAAIETLRAYPEVDMERRQALQTVIEEESHRLSARLEHTMAEYAEVLQSHWRFEEILGSDLLHAIQRRLKRDLHIESDVEELEDVWLRVNSFVVTPAVTAALSRFKDRVGEIGHVWLDLRRENHHAALTVELELSPAAATIDAAVEEVVLAMDNGPQLSLTEVAERHGGEVWLRRDPTNGRARLTLLLPTARPRPAWRAPVTQPSRPEFYDFDLFHQPDQRPELDRRPLTALTYTVFDLETTGLDPDEDEIISISAVRIVNSRLLRHELFDQLVDPRRAITPPAARVLDVSREMLRGQPGIEEVLPAFHQFVEDTVLVAHNAAFDMRFLQAKEAETGISFTNPVLDTLLLCAVVHPNQETHDLEVVAQRLGVPVVGRHTSLGDAIMAAEIVLRLIPLLADQDITTLAEARAASEKTYFARIEY